MIGLEHYLTFATFLSLAGAIVLALRHRLNAAAQLHFETAKATERKYAKPGQRL